MASCSPFLSFFILFLSAYAGCPEVSTQPGFNLTEYTRATWYIQYQQVTSYLPENTFYCTAATYDVEKKTVPFFRGKVVSVHNYDNIDEINGKNGNYKNQTLCARLPNNDEPAKLSVAPCFLPNFLAGDYWIIAAGPVPTYYDWAIVSGGQPTEQFDDGCTTKEDSVNGSGFWMFSRKPVASQETIDMMMNVAKEKGFTTQRLKKVQQEGCTYYQAIIKPDTRFNTSLARSKSRLLN